MSDITKLDGPAITMTSLEMVDFINTHEGREDLTHANFLKKLPLVLGAGGLIHFYDTYLHAQNGQQYPMYRLPKREACLMAMSYSYDLQAKVYDRMTELESKPIDPMRVLSDPAALRDLLVGYTEKVLALEDRVNELAPKAGALDRIATFSEGSYCMRDAAKVQQAPERKFIQYLDSHHWIYLQSPGQWRVYSEARKDGLMEQKTTTGQKPDGTEWQSVQVRVTAKGMTKLARAFEREGTPA